jgi:hypothetical protein
LKPITPTHRQGARVFFGYRTARNKKKGVRRNENTTV